VNISGGQGSEDKTGQNRFVQRKEVIRLISSMNATVGAKTAEQGLLKYKQVNTLLFMDQNKLCLNVYVKNGGQPENVIFP
jgi:hypothetical protein